MNKRSRYLPDSSSDLDKAIGLAGRAGPDVNRRQNRAGASRRVAATLVLLPLMALVGGCGEGSGDSDWNRGEASLVRFIAMGDTGTGSATQYAVGAAAATVCAQRGCDFALLLGDNFYENGVSSVDDPQFQTKFEDPYRDLDIPFYVVMGNHGYGGSTPDWSKSQYQVAYSSRSSKWKMPKEWFEVNHGAVQLVGIDTQRILWDKDVRVQRDFARNALAASSATWQIVFAHHPYISNGSHGNAGRYEGWSWPPFVSGATIKAFVEDTVCGRAEIYLSGHDHDRQWFPPTCGGTTFIISGAGAKLRPFQHRDRNPPTLFEDDRKNGFLYAAISGNVFTGAFYDQNGVLDFEHTIQR